MTSHASYPDVFPLYPAGLMINRVSIGNLSELPCVYELLNKSKNKWAPDIWTRGLVFLKGFKGSKQTLAKYRTELERFLLWCMVVVNKNPLDLTSMDVAEYFEFMNEPYPNWIGFKVQAHFNDDVINPKWRPFVAKNKKGRAIKNERELLKSYKPHKRSLLLAAASISSFYGYAVDEGFCKHNPVKRARKLTTLLSSDKIDSDFEGKRFGDQQWEILLGSAQKLANDNSKHERTLFLIATMKVLQLRISELSSRPVYEPTFADFSWDGAFWWLYVKGKGNKGRRIPVPSSYLPYLERYRTYRGLSPLPQDEDEQPIIAAIQSGPARSEKKPESVGLGGRQLARIIQHAFDAAALYCIEAGLTRNKEIFTRATTHMLRHTGASMAVEAGVPLKHVSENLGHGSSEFTDRIYVRSDERARAESSKNQAI